MNYADTILHGGQVFLGKNLKQDNTWVAIKKGKVLAIGENQIWQEYVNQETEIVTLPENALVVPGFHDSHLHLVMSALVTEFIDLSETKSEEEAAAMVKEYADTIPNDVWVIGLNWYHMNWKNRELPTASSLDKLLPDRPVYLTNVEVHGAWVNSKAMEVAGINSNTKNPPYGEIVKDEAGKPTGYLNEMAMGLVGKHAMKFDLKKERKLVQKIIQKYSEKGVTSVQDLRPELGYDLGQYETYYGLEQDNLLNVRIHTAANLSDDLNSILESQEKYSGEKFRVCLLKQYLDGVPTTHTAMVTEPYRDAPNNYGEPLGDLNDIGNRIDEAHRNGLSVKLHCCGDRAVKQALDFYQHALEKYGDTGAKHAVEHAEIIQPEDVERFKKLGVIASMQPEHMVIQVDKCNDNPYLEKYSESQLNKAWNFKTLLDKGVVVAFGSDCPVVEINPLMGIYRAVTRKFNDGNPKNGMNPEQKITVEEALHCYTFNSAYGVGRSHEMGTLLVGKYADMAVLDKNILNCDPEEIKTTKVLLTIMDGKVTFRG